MNTSCIKITPLLDTLKLQKIDDSEYFSAHYKDYISNSRLSLINPEQDGSPEKFFNGSTGIYSDSIVIGSVVHELTLQSNLFHLCETVERPTAKVGFMADELYDLFVRGEITVDSIITASDKIDYYKGKMDSKKINSFLDKAKPYWGNRREYELTLNDNTTPIYLDSKSREKVISCVNALKNNKSIQSLLHPKGIIDEPISENEQAILLDVLCEVPNYEPFTLKLKSKLDNYTIDKESNIITVNDIKTIGKILPEFSNNVIRFHYNRELSLYSWLLSLVCKKYYGMDNCIIKSNYLVVSTIPQYYTKVVSMNKSDFMKGWKEFVYLLKLVGYYYSQGYRWT